MPLRPRRVLVRASHRLLRQLGHPAALLVAIALSVVTSLPASALGAGVPAPTQPTSPARIPIETSTSTFAKRLASTIGSEPASPTLTGAVVDPLGRAWVRTDIDGNGAIGIGPGGDDGGPAYRAALVGGSGWWLPNGETGTRWIPFAWSAGSTGVAFSVRAVAADGRASAKTIVSILADADPPFATLDLLAVERGELTLRWRDGDGAGSGIAKRAVRIEQAAATPGGCGSFEPAGGIALDAGTYDSGTISLGQPPSTGCLRVSLALTDRVGHTSVTNGEPYRVQPPVSTAAANPEPTVERWSGRYNLYRAGAFVTQKTFRWCVAASVQMMVNLVRNHTDRTRATQARMIAYAQRWDNGPYGEDGGTDVTGWITALRHFGAGKYRAVGSTTAAGALRIAATAMRQTGRPAGILVMDGRHAWVLHGFESKTDPRLDSRAWISAVRISGPLYPLQRKGGYDPRPNTRLSARTLGRYFLPSSVGTLAGRYVVIIPTH